MRKLRRSHVAVALLVIASVVSLLGVSVVRAQVAEWVRIKNTKIVEKNVWFEEAPGRWKTRWVAKSSGLFASWGRTRMHMVMVADDLEVREGTEVRVYARLWNADKTDYRNVKVYSYTLTEGAPAQDIVLYVPSAKFYFWVYGPSDTMISLSFYLSGS